MAALGVPAVGRSVIHTSMCAILSYRDDPVHPLRPLRQGSGAGIVTLAVLSCSPQGKAFGIIPGSSRYEAMGVVGLPRSGSPETRGGLVPSPSLPLLRGRHDGRLLL